MTRLAAALAALAAFTWWTWLIYANGVSDGARENEMRFVWTAESPTP